MALSLSLSLARYLATCPTINFGKGFSDFLRLSRITGGYHVVLSPIPA